MSKREIKASPVEEEQEYPFLAGCITTLFILAIVYCATTIFDFTTSDGFEDEIGRQVRKLEWENKDRITEILNLQTQIKEIKHEQD